MSNINSGKFRETTATGCTKQQNDCWLDLQKDSKCFRACVCVCVVTFTLFRAAYQLLSPSSLLLLLCISVAALTLQLWYHSWQELLKRQQSKGLQERSSSEGGEQGMEMLTDNINWHPHAVHTTRYRSLLLPEGETDEVCCYVEADMDSFKCRDHHHVSM